MGPDILIPISVFVTIFGIVYLFVSTRNKERLALIEKGVDASIFMKGQNGIPTGRVIILNLALLLIGLYFLRPGRHLPCSDIYHGRHWFICGFQHDGEIGKRTTLICKGPFSAESPGENNCSNWHISSYPALQAPLSVAYEKMLRNRNAHQGIRSLI